MASAGGAGIYNYEADSGQIHVIRLKDETVELTIEGSIVGVVAGPPTSPFWAQVNRGAREYGLKPREVQFCFTAAPPGTLEANRTYSAAVADPADYNVATIGGVGTYRGVAIQITGKTPENIYPGI